MWQRSSWNQFCSRASCFCVNGNCETSASNDHNMIFNTKRSDTQYTRTSYSYQVPTFTLLRATGTRFWATGHFETTGPSDPQCVWTVKGRRCPIYMLQFLMSPICHSFYSMASHLWVTGYFETCASNNPKMTLDCKRSKVPYMYICIPYMLQLPPSPKFIPLRM